MATTRRTTDAPAIPPSQPPNTIRDPLAAFFKELAIRVRRCGGGPDWVADDEPLTNRLVAMAARRKVDLTAQITIADAEEWLGNLHQLGDEAIKRAMEDE